MSLVVTVRLPDSQRRLQEVTVPNQKNSTPAHKMNEPNNYKVLIGELPLH